MKDAIFFLILQRIDIIYIHLKDLKELDFLLE